MKKVGRFYPTERVAMSNRSDSPHQLLGSQVSLLHSMKKTGKKFFKRRKNYFILYLNSQGKSEESDRSEAHQKVERSHEEQPRLSSHEPVSPSDNNHLSSHFLLLNTNLGERLRKFEGRMALNFCTRMDGSSCFSSARVFFVSELIVEILSQTFWFLSQVFSMLEVWGTVGLEE